MATEFVKEVGTSIEKNEFGQEYLTIHMVIPCDANDPEAIQRRPIDCVPHTLWGFGEVQRSVWDQHEYRLFV